MPTESLAEALPREQARVRALDPKHAMSRGWSITRDASGAVVRSAADLTAGDVLVTSFADGRAESRVESVERENGSAP